MKCKKKKGLDLIIILLSLLNKKTLAFIYINIIILNLFLFNYIIIIRRLSFKINMVYEN